MTSGIQILDVDAIEKDLTDVLTRSLPRDDAEQEKERNEGGARRARGYRARSAALARRKRDPKIKQAVTKAVRKTFGAGQRYLVLDNRDPLVERTLVQVITRVPEIVHARQQQMTQENIDGLVDTYLKAEPVESARKLIELDNARERARFVEEFPCYSARQLAQLANHGASNESATANRWKSRSRIFGLPWKGSDLYPMFQFVEGEPHPAISRILKALPSKMTPWQIAFWLTSTNSWLDGAAPFEKLDQPDLVVAAAAREGETLAG